MGAVDCGAQRRNHVRCDYIIRSFRRADRQAVRDICTATAWMGEPAPRLAGDEWIWAEYWTRFFTDRERRTCWVVAGRRDGRVFGYLTGTADVARFERYVPFLLPGIVRHVIRRRLMRRRQPRRAILNLLRSLLVGEMELSAAVARLPEGARTVFVLYDVEGYAHAEIAAMTGIAEGTSKAQLHRARRLLREDLQR